MREPRDPVFKIDEEIDETARLVVVACVPVAFWKVRFWRVVEPKARIFEKTPSAELINPTKPVLARISEVEASPDTKRLVVVAFVEVEF